MAAYQNIQSPRMMPDLKRQRERMVRESLVGRITDEAVLRAMGTVPRHCFVPEALQARAYDPHALPIGFGQTISHPYIVAVMTQLLLAEPGMSVLEIGTGSGYQTAVLAEMGLTVFTIERVPELYNSAQALFLSLGLQERIQMRLGDGTLGWDQPQFFDRIIVTAGGPDIPAPLLEQLSDPGIMVIPVGGTRRAQRLVRVTKKNGKATARSLGNVTFVDLVGDHGWSSGRTLFEE